MALETNARIPSPYVYQPVDFGSKIDAQAANKAAALKAGIQAKKDLKTKNDAALAVKPTWTTEGVLNGAIENKANQIRDTYSKLAASGIPIWDATTPEGSAFAEEIAGLNKFSNEMKGYEQNINEIEAIKGADNDAYNFYVKKVGEAKDPAAVDAVVTSYRENKDLLAKAPDIRNAVAKVVNDKPLDTEIAEIKKASLGMKEVDMKKYLSTDKIQGIIDEIKTEEPSKLAEKLFNFKKQNDIQDPTFADYDTYDDYLADQVRTQVATRSSLTEGVKGSMTFVNNNYNGGGTNQTNTGNTGISGPGNVGYQFNSIGIPENVNGVFMMPINVSDDAIAKTGAAIENRAGQNYVKLEDLWRFEDKDNLHSKILLDWVWTDKQKTDKTWRPDQGKYYTVDNKEVTGKPSNIIWDQDGNGWANIESGGNTVKVLIYPKTPDIYGSQSDVTNNSKSNAKQLLVTFDQATPKGTLNSKAMSDPWTTVNNIFNRQTGLVTDIE
jgi:hypothetical protein